MISQKFHDLKEKCQKVKFIPVLALNEVSSAVDIAKVMVDAGLNVLEITLRTPQAWEILDKIKNALPHAIIGAGTILNEEQMLKAKNMELSFIVSPGSTIELMNRAIELDIPYLPGCVTASEVLNAHSRGYNFLKFFPAHAFGCVNVLKGFSGPFKKY